MKKFIPLVVIGLASASSFASEQQVFTTDEYCALQKDKISELNKQYTKVYAKRLGESPTSLECRKINKGNFKSNGEFTQNWDYKFNRPIRGSVIRLSPRTVKKLKENNLQGHEYYEI